MVLSTYVTDYIHDSFYNKYVWTPVTLPLAFLGAQTSTCLTKVCREDPGHASAEFCYQPVK